jgi:hypothetical protein
VHERAARPQEARQLLRPSDDADPPGDTPQYREPGTRGTTVQLDVLPAAVLAVEHRGDVADDLLLADAPIVGAVEVSADVHPARDLGERRAEAEEHDVGA